MGGKTSNKAAYFDKLKSLLEKYINIFADKRTIKHS